MVAHRSQPYEFLIADDDPGFRETVCSIFEHRAVMVEAGSGEEAIEIIKRRTVHLVLLDIHMPRLSGIETLRVVKSLRETLPCIVLSAGLTAELQHEAAEAQAQAVLRKPVTLRQLIGSVCLALQRVRRSERCELASRLIWGQERLRKFQTLPPRHQNVDGEDASGG